MSPPSTLRAVVAPLPNGPGSTETMLALVTELRERAELAEEEALRYRTALADVANMGRALRLGTDAGNEWACSGLNMLALRAERALEEP